MKEPLCNLLLLLPVPAKLERGQRASVTSVLGTWASADSRLYLGSSLNTVWNPTIKSQLQHGVLRAPYKRKRKIFSYLRQCYGLSQCHTRKVGEHWSCERLYRSRNEAHGHRTLGNIRSGSPTCSASRSGTYLYLYQPPTAAEYNSRAHRSHIWKWNGREKGRNGSGSPAWALCLALQRQQVIAPLEILFQTKHTAYKKLTSLPCTGTALISQGKRRWQSSNTL